MDFGFDAEVEEFRLRVAGELAGQMAALRSEASADPSDLSGVGEAAERRMLAWAGARGYLALSLPTRYGGGGRAPSWQAAFNLEAAAVDAPLVDTAVTLASQPVLAWGTEEQRSELLPAMARGEVIFCIAYTEEEAGSDLGALGAQARPEGDGFVLTGTKTHVTGAHKSDWCITVARTRPDGPTREALSMFVVPMDAPGVSVVRRATMGGWTLSDVTFDALRLGPGSLLGRRGDGWSQLLSAVGTEGSAMFHLGFARHLFEVLMGRMRVPGPGGAVPADDPVARDGLGRLAVQLAVAQRLGARALWGDETGVVTPCAAAMAKVYATELLQRMARWGVEVLGPDATALRPLFGPSGSATRDGEGRLGWEYLERVHGTIGGGTNEVKRNLIARAGLGLGRPA